ncbi:MAG: Ger(x)C family spore germination C-terminal domain-containing protein [Candidatus Borkfalkiaceae bacterium]|nr:Ger(x)C family spore germination C-terminal domain-containing protein [Christensenellaceae bacterium]
MNYRRAKILCIIFGFISLLFFTSDFQLIDIEKTAIIVALGVDFENDEYEITAQIAVPQAGDFSAGNSDAVITSKGKTVYEGIEKISQQSGWYPELSFCNIIVFGKTVVNKNAVALADYFLSSNKFQNSAILAACEGSAKDVLKSTTSLDFISSFALQKILLRNIDRANSVMVTDIREFCSNNRSVSRFCYLPLIKEIETDDKQKGSGDSGGNGGGGGDSSFVENGGVISAGNFGKNQQIIKKTNTGSGGSAGGGSAAGKNTEAGSGEKCVFDAGESILFSNGKPVCKFNREQTLCYNMLYEQVHESFVDLKYTDGETEKEVLIAVLDNKPNVSLKVEKGGLKAKIFLELTCRKEELDENQSIKGLEKQKILTDKELFALQQKTVNAINSLISLSRENDCDLFRFKENLYRYNPQYFPALKDLVVNSLQIEIEVKCVNYN